MVIQINRLIILNLEKSSDLCNHNVKKLWLNTQPWESKLIHETRTNFLLY
jgi:hypothetical protein